MLNRIFLAFALLCFAIGTHASLFGSKAIPAHEAIQFETETTDTELLVVFDLADNIYLYQDKIKLTFPDKSKYPHRRFLETPETIEDPAFGKVDVFYNSATLAIDRSQLPASTESITIKYQGCDEAIGLCYPPQKAQLDITPATKTSTTQPTTDNDLDSASGIFGFLQGAGALLVVATFLVLGIGLTFTPCVLPMVPILSSVIAGQKDLTTSKGFVLSTTYVLGMAITYALAGVLVGLMGARFNLQIYMQQPVVLGVFAGLFVLLALSMFGFYELRLPRFIQDPLDRMNQKQQGGSLISVFIMGALSAIVVSPCVSAPLAGALVYISTTGDAILGGSALFALGLGMGLPLIAIGTTGASMLPKAGAWMDKVKHFFGVLLIAVALWLLGRVLPEDIYLWGWVVLLGLYAVVLGAFESAETIKQRLVKGVALLTFSFAMILMFKLLVDTPRTQTVTTAPALESTISQSTSNSFFTTIKNKDIFETTLSNAHKNEKLVFVDVYADWCIECKIMAKTLFADPDVQNAMEDFIRIKLDITAFDDFHKSYLEEQGVFGPPALLFYGLDGSSIKEAQILGEISKADFLNHLDQFDP
jgi:thiol:disulfide interchange protein DsbD